MAAPAQITMVRVSEFDKVFNDAQRQGRISFYLTGRGEEACSVASAAALGDDDFILPQYRELGAAFWRGFTFEDISSQKDAFTWLEEVQRPPVSPLSASPAL